MDISTDIYHYTKEEIFTLWKKEKRLLNQFYTEEMQKMMPTIAQELLNTPLYKTISTKETKTRKIKTLNKKIKSICENTIIIFLISDNKVDKDLIKYANAFFTNDMSEDLILSTLNINLRMKSSLDMLSNSNKDLADSLYRLNALYSTSSQFAGTLDKSKLIQYMIEGMDKALSFSLTCTLSLCTEEKPVLLINSLYELSEELITALKLRVILNYNSLFEGKTLPANITLDNLKVISKTYWCEHIIILE